MTGNAKKKNRANEISRDKVSRSGSQQAGSSRVDADGKGDDDAEDTIPTNMLGYILQALRLEVL
jgi:hypothetical protein